MNNKALIIGPAWVGDMVMADTLVQLLGGRFAEIHMAAPPATAPVAERMPGISQVHVIDFTHGELGLGKRRAVGKGFADQGYEAAFVLPNSWKSALVPYFAGIPRRTGWQGEARYVLLNDRRKPVAVSTDLQTFRTRPERGLRRQAGTCLGNFRQHLPQVQRA